MSELRDDFIDALLPMLSPSPVLRALATLQRTLDCLDIEGLATLYEEVRGVTIGSASSREPKPTIEEWNSFLDEFFARQRAHEVIAPERNDSTLRFHILAYALSATVKDCSLMLRVPTVGESTERSIKVIDLDIKDPNRLSAWQSLDASIVSQYANVSRSERKTCVDACV